jgi:DNA-binding CsgD family transcriptional regulator
VELADEPAARAEACLRGIRALGLASLIEEVQSIAHAGLADTTGMPPESVARIEAELFAPSLMTLATQSEALRRLSEPAVPRRTSELWRVNAAAAATFAGEPARETLAVLDPVLSTGALAAEADSVLHTVTACTLVWNEAPDVAVELCDGVVDAAWRRGWVTTMAHGSYARGLARLAQGAISDAEADARFAFEFKLRTLRVPFALLLTVAPLLDALVEADRVADAEAVLESMPLPEPLPEHMPAAVFLQNRGHLRHAQGREDEALADLRDAGKRWDDLDIRHPVVADWRLKAVTILAESGERLEARRLAAEQLALAERVGTPGTISAALRAQAEAAPRADRVPLLERAVSLAADSQAGLEHCRALVDLGAALRRAGRRGEARDPLRAALDLASRGGAVRLARRADEELRAAGARPRRAALSGPEALTGAEHRVAKLAAEGRTNRQIAQALFVSRRTVETHLAHAFQKLGISAREQLAERLAA